jgi:hypothetical protein
VVDEIVNGKIQLIINTPLGRESFFDDRAVRRVAMMQTGAVHHDADRRVGGRRGAIRALRTQALTCARCRTTTAAPVQGSWPAERSGRLPRWRGFNLLEKFNAERQAPFVERDFQMMADWGFDFVRLPLSYWCWGGPDDLFEMREADLKEIDQAVAFGRRHHVHVNINFHRAPGYCVNPPPEPVNLWTDAVALDASAHHWGPSPGVTRDFPRRRSASTC